ncbi:hypothetical protein BB8028_0003g13090 [Beauveria bassiana]|uniref:Gastric mucin-like protein n=1 Tax=Beauveria bassiana TaxID=176275 RepID=A0A2S7Y9J2_BEABA|nr:hypothetical protein BB8028_0003g13090 [Beauveria bassiana]
MESEKISGVAMAEETSWERAVVAIEGPKTIVTTQLRLLPSNPQILILPALETYIPMPASYLDVFDPVQYLRQVNAAMKRRHRDTQTFLQSSGGSGKEGGGRRLVFLEGGAASAHALCLRALMQHETAGDREAAEAMLSRLVGSGGGDMANLAQAERERAHSAPVIYSASYPADDDDEESSDPSTRAMRAADALDRQTASLQVSNELDLTIHSLSRSSNVPVFGHADTTSGDTAPFLVFGQSSALDDDDDGGTPVTEQRRAKLPTVCETKRFSVVHYNENEDMPSVFGFDDFPTAKSFVSTVVDGDSTPKRLSTGQQQLHHHQPQQQQQHPQRRLTSEPISPMSDAFSMRSIGNVEYGHASLLDMRTSVRGDAVMGVKAVRRGTATHKPKLNEHIIAETGLPVYNINIMPARPRGQTVPAIQPSLSTGSTSTSTMSAHPIMRVPSLSSSKTPTTTDSPRTVSVKRTRPVIKLQPVPNGRKRRWQQGKSTYIDDDVDLAGAPPPSESASDFEPVFPRMEDLVLYLRSELTPQPLLESALNAMREEYMRKSACLSESPSSKASTASTESFKSQTDDGTADLTSPETSGTEELDADDKQETPTTAVNMTAQALPSMDDYDPFAYINPAYGSAQPSTVSKKPSVTILRPPTPAQTPPPQEVFEADSTEIVPPEQPVQNQEDIVSEKEVVEEIDRSIIHELDVEPMQAPIAVQNAIRSVLHQQYPFPSNMYAPQFQFPLQLLPNTNDPWRSIFPGCGVSNSLSAPNGRHGHQLKQILAVGLQNGINREYAARVISQIEKFGTEPTGSARCARLDFRYLLANTMQAFTSRSFGSQTMAENPFGNPELLATLILPHLETYLAVHADVRFLILEYPAEHLATVIAMQKLAGVDLVKIAQIVDARSKDRLPFRHVREGSVDSTSSVSASASSVYSRRSSSLTTTSRSITSDVSRTKANFLLTSSASGRDVADFVAAVWDLPVAEDRPLPPTPPEKTGMMITADAAHNTDDEHSPPPSLPQAQPSPDSMVTPSAPKATSPKTRKIKPSPLRVNALSAFPKLTGPQSPLSAAAHMKSVLAPPPPPPSSSFSMTPPTSSKPSLAVEDYYTTTAPSRSPSPPDSNSNSDCATYSRHSKHTAPRTSAVGGGPVVVSSNNSSSSSGGSTLLIRRRLSSSTMRTTNSGVSSMSRASTPHIAYMRKMPAPGTQSRPYTSHGSSTTSSLSTLQYQQQHASSVSLMPPAPRFLDTPYGGSTLNNSPVMLPDNRSEYAASIMTFNPDDDSDYDQEERRLMPFFGKKRSRKKPGTQKALKVLGMMA